MRGSWLQVRSQLVLLCDSPPLPDDLTLGTNDRGDGSGQITDIDTWLELRALLSIFLQLIFSSRLSVNFLTSGFQHLLTKVLHTYRGVNGDQTPSTPPSYSLMPDAHPCPSLPKVYCRMKKDGENYLDIADSWPCGFSSVPHSGQRVILFIETDLSSS